MRSRWWEPETTAILSQVYAYPWFAGEVSLQVPYLENFKVCPFCSHPFTTRAKSFSLRFNRVHLCISTINVLQSAWQWCPHGQSCLPNQTCITFRKSPAYSGFG